MSLSTQGTDGGATVFGIHFGIGRRRWLEIFRNASRLPVTAHLLLP
jgi:hypothetical protein